MDEAACLWFEYKRMMAQRLNLHPLDWQEIQDRRSQLRAMEAAAQQTDTESMRVGYELYSFRPPLDAMPAPHSNQ